MRHGSHLGSAKLHLERIRVALGIGLATSTSQVCKKFEIDLLCGDDNITFEKFEEHMKDRLIHPGDLDWVLAALNVGDSDRIVCPKSICGSLHYICGEGRMDDDVFKFIDANRDGHISFKELESFFCGLFATAFAFMEGDIERKLGCTFESLAIALTHDAFAYVSKFYDLEDETLDTLTMSYDAAKRVLRNRGFFDATLLIEGILKQKQLRDNTPSPKTNTATTSNHLETSPEWWADLQ